MVHTKQLRKGGCGGDEDVAAEVAQGHEQVCSPSPSTRGASLPVPLRPSVNIGAYLLLLSLALALRLLLHVLLPLLHLLTFPPSPRGETTRFADLS
jgi:hypothetical protein